MRIILKPLGVVVVGAAMTILAVMAVRGGQASKSAPAAVSVAAPNATVAAASSPGDIVYDNALKNGWSDFSWAKHDLADSKQATPGMCIRVESKKFEAVAFHHAALDMAPYDRVAFRIHGGDTGRQRLKLVAQYESGKEVKNATEHILPVLSAKEWKTVTVALEDLGIANKANVVGFWLQEGYGETLAPYYVDDIRLLRPSEMAPTP